MKIKTILIGSLVFSIMIISGCDDRQDIFENLNAPPSLTFNTFKPVDIETNTLRDSVKISLKSKSRRYKIRLDLEDENNNLDLIRFEAISGNGNFYYNGQILGSGEIDILDKEFLIEYEPSNVGFHSINFVASDKFGLSAEGQLELTAFKNLPPVAEVEISEIKVRSPLEFKISAAKSIDQDQGFGGFLTKYIYTINDKTIITAKDNINWIFPESGNVLLTIRVEDNDGAVSEIVSKTVLIN